MIFGSPLFSSLSYVFFILFISVSFTLSFGHLVNPDTKTVKIYSHETIFGHLRRDVTLGVFPGFAVKRIDLTRVLTPELLPGPRHVTSAQVR